MHISSLGSNSLTAPASTLTETTLSSSVTVIAEFDAGNWLLAPVLQVTIAEEASSTSMPTTSGAGASGWIG
jgi:hypothetical protein